MRFFVTCDHVIVTFISFDTTDFLPSASEISLFLHSLDVPPRGNISVGNRADYFLIAHVKKCSEVSFVFLYPTQNNRTAAVYATITAKAKIYKTNTR